MLDEIPKPLAARQLFGHQAAEAAFLEAYRSGRMHHAWLITGPPGIGKASFAFRAACYLLQYPDPFDPALALHGDLAVDPASRVAAKVAAGAHANLLHLKRPWDEKNKRHKTEIPVEEVRRTHAFFGQTAAEEGWRICLIDSADELNTNAANALLKTLEEPTAKGIYLIVCHNPGRILATIRSRCRTLRLQTLEPDVLRQAVRSILDHHGVSVSEDELDVTVDASRGSVGKALTFLMAGGLEVAAAFRALIDRFPSVDRAGLHAFAQRLAGREAELQFDLFCDLAYELAADRIRDAGASLAVRARWGEAGRVVTETAREQRIYNLDRKQAVISMMESLADAAPRPISHPRTP